MKVPLPALAVSSNVIVPPPALSKLPSLVKTPLPAVEDSRNWVAPLATVFVKVPLLALELPRKIVRPLAILVWGGAPSLIKTALPALELSKNLIVPPTRRVRRHGRFSCPIFYSVYCVSKG